MDPPSSRLAQNPVAAAPAGRLAAWCAPLAIDLRTLAVTRIALALVLLADLTVRFTDLRAMYTDGGILPREVLREYHRYAGDWFWTLHGLSGSATFAAALFLLAGVLAVLLLVGYRTRWATLGCWLLLVSLHHRNPLLVTGGDVLLAMLLFWGLFLPWGAYGSLDARRHPERPRGDSLVCSPATAAILLQVALMYLLTGLGKLNPIWLSGEAIHNALAYDMIARPWGRALLEYPQFLRVLTWGTLGLELAAPWLLLTPWIWRGTRPWALAGLVALHLGIEVTMRVTVFSFASLAGLTLFLAPWFWRPAWIRRALGMRRLPGLAESGGAPAEETSPAKGAAGAAWWSGLTGSSQGWTNRLVNAIVVLLMLYVFSYNIGWQWGGDRFLVDWPAPLHRLADLGRFRQRWTMFVRPSADDYRFALAARLNDGRVVDVLRGGVPLDFGEARHWPARMPSQRWMLAFRELSDDRNSWFRQSAADYFYRRWNARHAEPERIEMLDLLMVQVKPWLPGPQGPPMIRLAQIDSRAQGPFRNGERHGEWVLLHGNGRVQSQGRYVAGKRQGRWTFFHENGEKSAEGPYRDDLEHGRWVHWYADGRKEAEGDYREGRMHGRWDYWLQDGRRLEVTYERGRPLPADSGANVARGGT